MMGAATMRVDRSPGSARRAKAARRLPVVTGLAPWAARVRWAPRALLVLLAALCAPAAVGAGAVATDQGAGRATATELEVLHFWTSGGEAKALAQLKQRMLAKGVAWRDLAVAGGAGDNAKTALKARVLSGNPPAAAQMNMPAIAEWGREGVLGNLDALAAAGRWDAVLPAVIARGMKYDGHYVAVPANVHRVSTMFVNPAVFAKAGAAVPHSWEEFFVAADKIRAAGMVPLAHGGQPWQDAVLFQALALGVGGPLFYQKALVEMDQATLQGPVMLAVLTQFARLRRYIDKDAAGRDWNVATGMVMSGKAGMQIMGDWAKGEFANAGKVPGQDYLCLPAPGTQGAFMFQADAFALFSTRSPALARAQSLFATAVMGADFQQSFSLAKGSVPARTGIAAAPFDSCAQRAMADLRAANAGGTLVPSLGMVASATQEGAIGDVLTEFVNSSMTPQAARTALAKAALER